MTTDREDDLSPGGGELECELLPRRAGADHENGPVREQVGPPVVRGAQRRDLAWRREGDVRIGGGAGRDHDVAREPRATRGLDPERRPAPLDPRDVDAFD